MAVTSISRGPVAEVGQERPVRPLNISPWALTPKLPDKISFAVVNVPGGANKIFSILRF